MAGTNWIDIAKYVVWARPDIAPSVTHWTKNHNGQDAFSNLKSIIESKKIKASLSDVGFIKGGNQATCFTEAPVAVMTRVFRIQEVVEKTRKFVNYEPYGLSFFKPVIYGRYNGRPVIYFSQEEYNKFVFAKGLIHSLGWRIVTFDQAGTEGSIDWTHEREWRVPGDVDLAELQGSHRPIVIVRTEREANELLKLYPDDDKRCFRSILNLRDLSVG